MKILRVPPYPGVGLGVKVRGWEPWKSEGEGRGVDGTFSFFFLNSKSPFKKNIFILWSWNLQKMFVLSFSFCISKISSEIPIFRILIAKFWIFTYFSRKIAIFKFHHALWRHNCVMPWPIVLIMVCMDRDINAYILKVFFFSLSSNQGDGCNPPYGFFLVPPKC